MKTLLNWPKEDIFCPFKFHVRHLGITVIVITVIGLGTVIIKHRGACLVGSVQMIEHHIIKHRSACMVGSDQMIKHHIIRHCGACLVGRDQIIEHHIIKEVQSEFSKCTLY